MNLSLVELACPALSYFLRSLCTDHLITVLLANKQAGILGFQSVERICSIEEVFAVNFADAGASNFVEPLELC